MPGQLQRLALAAALLASAASGLCAQGPRAAEPPPLLVRAVDGHGRPLAGVTVRAAAEPDDRPDAIVQAETGPDGTARLSGLPDDDRTVWVLAERKGLSPALRSFAGASEARRELRIVLEPGTLTEGRVVDEEGRPVADAEIELIGMPFKLPWGSIPSVAKDRIVIQIHTNPTGRFHLRDLAPGSFQMAIRHPGAAPLMVDRRVEAGRNGRLGTFVLRRGATLRGTVLNPAGRPVSGARVWAEASWESTDYSTASAVTAADGTFAVPRRPPGEELSLWICANGFLQRYEKVPFADEPVRVVLSPAATARGRVLGPDGAPYAGASVRAGTGHGRVNRAASPCPEDDPVTTDAEGRFAFERIFPGRFQLVATAPGLLDGLSDELQLEPGEAAEDQEIRLQSGATLSGRVVDPSGAPIPGAQLHIFSERTPTESIVEPGGRHRWFRPSIAEGTSGVDGWFRLTGLPAELLQLSVWAEGYDIGDIEIDLTPHEGTTEGTTEVVLAREGTIELHGYVLAPDGTPVEGASVKIAEHRSVSTARDGSFAIRGYDRLLDDPVVVVAEKRGFAPGRKAFLIESERVDGIVVRLETGVLVNGRVLGLAGGDSLATITLVDRRGGGRGEEVPGLPEPTDSEGRFQLGPLPAGTWEIQAASGQRLAAKSVTLEPGQTEAFVELTFAPVQEVSGRVLTPDGRPAARVRLQASDTQGKELGYAWTHVDGTFSLRVPEGDLWLFVIHEDLRSRRTLRVGQSPVTGVDIRLERGAVLHGRLLGLPPDASPMIFFEGPVSSLGLTKPDGTWSAADRLTSGTWQLEARHSLEDGGVQVLRQTFDVPPGLSELELDLDFTDIPAVDPEILETEPKEISP